MLEKKGRERHSEMGNLGRCGVCVGGGGMRCAPSSGKLRDTHPNTPDFFFVTRKGQNHKMVRHHGRRKGAPSSIVGRPGVRSQRLAHARAGSTSTYWLTQEEKLRTLRSEVEAMSDAQGVVEGMATVQQKLETMAQTLETQQRLEQLKRQKRESDTELEVRRKHSTQAFEAEVVAQMASFKTMRHNSAEFNEEYGERFNGIWSLHGPLDVSRYPSCICSTTKCGIETSCC